MATVWNAADETTNITLSNTNHTATSTAGGNNGIRSIGVSHSTGKWYLEFTNILSPGGSGSYGFAVAGDALGGAGQCGVDPGGNLHGTGGTTAMGSAPDGKTLAFAIDLDHGKIWARYDAGAWVGDGTAGADPSSNTHGLVNAPTVPLLLHTWLQNNPGHVTLNAGDSAFVQSVPSGFTAWDSPVIFPTAQSRIIG